MKFQARYIPNVITIIRLMLVPPVAWAILSEAYHLAFWLFFLAGFSDGVDGFLARQFSWQSRLGATLDPLADKLLMIVSFYCLFWQSIIPLGLFAVIAIRDLIILGGALAYHFITRALQMQPIILGKINTALQILLVMAILVHYSYGLISANLINLLVISLLVSTIVSGVAYVLIWYRKTRVFRDVTK
jgi:cardiolipin synthase